MHSSRMRAARLLTVSQHALLGGVPAGGVPGGGVPAREMYLLGVYLAGVLVQGGVPTRGYLPRYPPCEQNDRQVQKYYLAPNFVCGW